MQPVLQHMLHTCSRGQGVDYGMSKRLEMLFPYVYGKPGNAFPYGIDMAYSRRAGAGTTMVHQTIAMHRHAWAILNLQEH